MRDAPLRHRRHRADEGGHERLRLPERPVPNDVVRVGERYARNELDVHPGGPRFLAIVRGAGHGQAPQLAEDVVFVAKERARRALPDRVPDLGDTREHVLAVHVSEVATREDHLARVGRGKDGRHGAIQTGDRFDARLVEHVLRERKRARVIGRGTPAWGARRRSVSM